MVVLRVEPGMIRPFSYIYAHQKLPSWLMDTAFIKDLFFRIQVFTGSPCHVVFHYDHLLPVL